MSGLNTNSGLMAINIVTNLDLNTNSYCTPCQTYLELENRDEIESAYRLYKEFIKSENFQEAFKYWIKAITEAPGGNGINNDQFEDGVFLYRIKFDLAGDNEKKKIVEKIMELYDKNIECFGNSGYNIGRKGYDYFYHYRSFTDDNSIFNLLYESLSIDGLQSQRFILVPLAKLLIRKYFRTKNINIEFAKHYVHYINDVINVGLKTKKDKADWQYINEYVKRLFKKFEEVAGFYDCYYYLSKYKAKDSFDRSDCALLKSTRRGLLESECDLRNDLHSEITNYLNENCSPICSVVDLSKPSTCLVEGKRALEESNFDLAISKYICVFNELVDSTRKSRLSLSIAKLYLKDKANYEKSRIWALKAAEFNPNWGEPFMLIGKLYFNSLEMCSGNSFFEKRAIQWCAMDMFEKAKSVDSYAIQNANQLIEHMKLNMPTESEIIARSLKYGATYKVGCWINRNTTVRKAP